MNPKATKQKLPGKSSLMAPGNRGFHVTATIGYVEFGNGDQSPVEAAMSLIGKHNREGTYRFPHEDGGEWVVDMQHDRMEGNGSDEDSWDG